MTTKAAREARTMDAAQLKAALAQALRDLAAYEGTKADLKTGTLPKHMRTEGADMRWPRAIHRRIDAYRNALARLASNLGA